MPIIVKVERPDLTEQERAAQMELLKRATVDLIRAAEKGAKHDEENLD